MFTTRDVLYCGARKAIDSVLKRLVDSGDLIRLARGVFISSRCAELPSVRDIVKTKAAAFHRQIFMHWQEAAQELGLDSEVTVDGPTFATTGGNSSFAIHAHEKVRVYLKNTCPRKLKLEDSPTGRAIRAVWNVCRKTFGMTEHAERALKTKLGRTHWDEFICSFQILPAWIFDEYQATAVKVLMRYRHSRNGGGGGTVEEPASSDYMATKRKERIDRSLKTTPTVVGL